MAVMQKNHIYLLNGQQILKTDTLEAAEDGFTAAFYDMEELEKLCLQGRYPQQLFNEGKNLRITKLEEYEESVLCALCVPIKSDILKSHAKFTILIRKDQMIFALYNREAEELLETFTPSRPAKGMTPERFLYEYLGSLLESDLAFLGELENQITRLEERTLNNMLDNFNRKIVKVRKELMYLHSFYAQLLDLAEGLEANEYDYFESGRYFDHLSKRVERLCQYAELLREYSVQIREIYQALDRCQAESDHEASDRGIHDLSASVADCGLVRDEFCQHAGTGVEVRISGRSGDQHSGGAHMHLVF